MTPFRLSRLTHVLGTLLIAANVALAARLVWEQAVLTRIAGPVRRGLAPPR